MGKTADLTVVQKTTIDTLHKEGKTQKVIAKEAGCSQSSVSKHINREAKGRKRCGRKKCTSNRDNRTLERIVKQNPFKNVGEIHKEWTAAGVSASRTTTHRRMQDMGFSCRIPCVKPLLNNRQRQKRFAWAKDKKDWTAAEWSKVMFSMHLPTLPKLPVPGLRTMVSLFVIGQQTNRKSMGYCEEEDTICQTQQCRRAKGHYQSNLGSHNT